ncbi:LeuA family protein [Pendulispora albinea]|uniref:LeuA family protein n=1 Tax=Pendulispora albinea TaxID=2741071 RepID=A0ABZ2LT13_9BACT
MHASPSEDIVHDWNDTDPEPAPAQSIELNDETLRDGIQSPSATDPSLEDKIELLELMESLGIRSVNLGLPASGPRAFENVVALARWIRDRGSRLLPNAAARTVIADVRPIVEAVQKTGQNIEVHTFIGSSPVRLWAENWELESMVAMATQSIDFAIAEGLEVAFVTEDTVRSPPRNLERLFRAAIDHGATRLVLCDTVGHATPAGTRALVRWTKQLVAQTGHDVKLDWHGHNDRGLAIMNAFAAMEAGADRIHGCALGLGERVGNTPMDLLLLNLKLMGWISHDLSKLVAYVRKASEACKFPIPVNYPLSGEDAFRTTTGVHAAAIIKAKKRGGDWLAERVYSGVPAGDFGKEQTIEIGPMSGMNNVRYWLDRRGVPYDDSLCAAILARAKTFARTLTDEDVFAIVHESRQGSS